MARITGCFPVLGSNLIVKNAGREVRKTGTGMTTVPINPGQTEFLYSSVLKAMYNHSERKVNSSGLTNYFGAYNVKVVGAPTLGIPNVLLEAPKVRKNHKDFKARVRRGEMLVSDYSNITAMLSFTNGGPKKVIRSFENSNFTTSVLVQGFERPLYSFAGIDNRYSISVNPEREYLDVTWRYPYQEITFTDETNPYDVGWDNSVIQDFIDHFKYPDEIYGLVTGNTSDANNATVDILTSLAELPETAAMILQGFNGLVKLFKDAKHKKFRLYDKAKRVRVEATEKINRIDFDCHFKYLAAKTKRAKAVIEKQRLARIKQVKADLTKFLADIATATAQVELTVRYGILPVKYTIDGLIESYENMEQVYKRWSAKETVEVEFPDVPGFIKNGTCQVNLRAFIKRKFDAISGHMKMLKHFSGSLIVTAYELIPLSFVVDWFINIGDVLKSFFGNTFSGYTEAATISLKIENAKCSYVHKTTGCTVDVEIKGYMRNVINPRDYCRFVWSPDVSGYRTYDAISLSWLFTKRFLKSY